MTGRKLLYVVEDDEALRDAVVALLEVDGWEVQAFRSAGDFLGEYDGNGGGCVICDVRLPGMGGLELLQHLNRLDGKSLPVVLMSAHADVQTAVEAMRAGAIDFLEKPFEAEALFAAVNRALKPSPPKHAFEAAAADAERTLQVLSRRETDVLRGLAAGLSNKQIALELDLSPRTVEHHRAHIMEKLQVRGLSQLVKLWMLAHRMS